MSSLHDVVSAGIDAGRRASSLLTIAGAGAAAAALALLVLASMVVGGAPVPQGEQAAILLVGP